MYLKSLPVCDEEISLDHQVKQFWDLETLGIKENKPTVYEKFITDIRHDGERYEVKLPFKEFHPVLPDNYQLSKRRLGSLLEAQVKAASPRTLRRNNS